MSDLPSRDKQIAAYMEDPDLLADLVADRVDGRLVDREAIDHEAVYRLVGNELGDRILNAALGMTDD